MAAKQPQIGECGFSVKTVTLLKAVTAAQSIGDESPHHRFCIHIKNMGQISVSIRSELVDPGCPNGTPAVISNVSPRSAMPCAWAISSAVEHTSST